MKFIPKPVIIVFVNALGILMLQSQLDYFKGSSILLVLGAIGVAIIYLLLKFLIPNVPLNMETLMIILPYSIYVALI